jgi:aspartate racemase
MKLAIAMAASGVATEAQRLVFNTVSRKLIEENDAEAIMLGGTDLALVFNQQDTAFPLWTALPSMSTRL